MESRNGLTAQYAQDGQYRILALDGGGAKGFYTLGVLKEIEGMLNCPLYKRFHLVFVYSCIRGQTTIIFESFEDKRGTSPIVKR